MSMDSYLRFVAALVFVLALIGLAAWALRRLGVAPRVRARQRGERRLEIVEVAVLDARRRLVLIRRDDVEHLLILGPNSELVVERGIAPTPRFSEVLGATEEEAAR